MDSWRKGCMPVSGFRGWPLAAMAGLDAADLCHYEN
jgi:hypothetical protein